MARVDIKRTAMSAAIQTNWMPRVLGSMMLRPGLGYILTQPSLTKPIPFVFASDDTAKIDVHDGTTAFAISDVALTRPAVTAAVTNGTFGSNIASWTAVTASGGVNAWQTGGYAGLTGNGTGALGTDISSLLQSVTVNEVGTEHALRVVIQRGPITIRVGSTSNGTEYINDYLLETGSHTIAFTPSASPFYIKMFNPTARMALIDSCAVESSGVVNLVSPWAAADLSLIRYDQSGDIVFVACSGKPQYMIMRRAARSWSIQKYLTSDGPFMIENTGTTTITPSATTGNITLTSSSTSSTGIFKSTHVGALFSLTSTGQTVFSSISAQNTFTTHIIVTGTSTGRQFAIDVAGTFVATVTLQRSVDEGVTWVDIASYTIETDATWTDGLENQTVWYRIGVKTGGYTSGTVVCTLLFAAGQVVGAVRVTAFTSSTVVSAEVLTTLGDTDATDIWAEGAWSDYRGWPSVVRFHDARLWWIGKDHFWGSVTDQYYTFDASFEGDAGPISRTIGYGPVDDMNWALSLGRLVVGTDGAEIACRSSNFDEPLTPTQFQPKSASNLGSSRIAAVSIDNKGIFVGKNTRRVYEIVFDAGQGEYSPELLTQMCPEIGDPGIIVMGVQRSPDTRLHCIRSDGTVGVLIFDRAENVICWVDVETDGLVVDVCVLPGAEEDYVYYEVQRVIGGSTVNYTERWAFESECRGAAINKLADSFVYAAGASSTITGLSHLNGETVVAWGGGADLGTFVVSGGSITLHASTTYTNRCAGLPYTATYKGTKLAYSLPGKTGLTKTKKVDHIGLILVDTHPNGLEYGPSFDTMDPLPEVEAYQDVAADTPWDEYEEIPIEFPGEWSTDSRVCLRATAPRACTVLAVVVELETR